MPSPRTDLFHNRTIAMAMPGVRIEFRPGKPPEAKRHSPEMFSASWHCFPRLGEWSGSVSAQGVQAVHLSSQLEESPSNSSCSRIMHRNHSCASRASWMP